VVVSVNTKPDTTPAATQTAAAQVN
jgi:hypothetical protein